MVSIDMFRDISAEEAEIPGMKTLYADRSETAKVTYIKDVIYDKRSGVPLHLQMLYPKVPSALLETISGKEPANPFQTNPNLPCVVYVQGSAWGKQDCYKSLPLLMDIARQGFVVASVEYRPVQTERFPGFVSDVKAAIRFLKANHVLYGIDPGRVAVWGCSSGGHTAMMVGTTGWTKEFDEGIFEEVSSEVCACVSFYGVSEFRPFLPGGRFARPMLFEALLGSDVPMTEENADRLSPVAYVQEGRKFPPFLMIHGDRDPIVPFEQSVFLYQRLRELGSHVELIKVSGAGHGDFFWTPEVMAATAAFLKAFV